MRTASRFEDVAGPIVAYPAVPSKKRNWTSPATRTCNTAKRDAKSDAEERNDEQKEERTEQAQLMCFSLLVATTSLLRESNSLFKKHETA